MNEKDLANIIKNNLVEPAQALYDKAMKTLKNGSKNKEISPHLVMHAINLAFQQIKK